MTSEFIINVSELNFEYEVVSYSMNTPVIVDFWAEWCQPCKTLTPVLEQVVLEAAGSIRMAKVNIDQNPNLALQYGVRSIPTVKAFVQGAVVLEFVGVQPPNRVRSFIEQLSPPSPIDLAVEKASSLLINGNWTDAESIFCEMHSAANPTLLQDYWDYPNLYWRRGNLLKRCNYCAIFQPVVNSAMLKT